MKELYQKMLDRLNELNQQNYMTVGEPAPCTITVINKGEVTVGFDPVDEDDKEDGV